MSASRSGRPVAVSAAEIAKTLGRPEPTAEQVAVIEAPLEPLLVVAGAGSGKTETMSARVVWLVANGLVRPDQVLGLTFTRKAAGELADRVRARLRALRRAGLGWPGEDAVDGTGAVDADVAEPTVSTYHSYAASVVADHGLRLGVEPASRLLGEAAAWQLATEVVESWDGSGHDMAALTNAPGTVVDAVLALAAECSEHLVDPEDIEQHLVAVLRRLESLPRTEAGDAPGKPSADTRTVLAALHRRRLVVPMLQRYTERKRELEVLDFGDQVRLAASIAQSVPAVGAGERSRFPVVLLDEYQDTSHAQLVLLRALFGRGHPVTAVGDPHQSIYGWRGASAGNLQAFPGQFCRRGGEPASVAYLRTSWRNDEAVLAVANVLAAPLRAGPVDVPPLESRPGARRGFVLARYHRDVGEEADALAGDLARLWSQDDVVVAQGGLRRSMAVLCRKRSQFEVVEHALRAVGLPVEVVGLGGLLSRPEVVDLVAALTVVHDPTRGDALMRLLTGPRWRMGPRDLESLGEWARELSARHRAWAPAGSTAQVAPDVVEERSLVDALDALPRLSWAGRHGRGFSATGHRRLRELAALLAALRSHASLPLPDLVAETERALLLDVEVAARSGTDPSGARGNLDALTDVAASFADGADRPTLGAFLAWLAAAETRERGLEAGDEDDTSLAPDVEPSRSAVQVLTVHAAKGLEWDVVAVPGLSEGTFPSRRSVPRDPTAPDKGSGWLTGLGVLPYELRGDRAALPAWHWRAVGTQKELDAERERFRVDCGRHEVAEERRLAYVAATRARSLLLLSGAWWAEGTTPRRPSRFLLELEAAFRSTPSPPGAEVMGVEVQGLDDATVAAGPQEDENPRLAEPRSAVWPSDPLGPRRHALEQAAERVRSAASPPQTSRWGEEVDRLLAERDRAGRGGSATVGLPVHLSASRLVELAADPAGLAAAIRRPMPAEPRPQTRRGTAFHAWLERRFRASTLVDVLDLPGAGDESAPADAELRRLQEAFEASEWAHRTPVAVEVDLETPVAGVVLRGRVDAVFTRPGGGWEVVDWKTGAPPGGERRRAAAVQLAAYRLAWARLHGVPVREVGGAFFYASTGETIRPADALDEAGLVALITSVPAEESVVSPPSR